MRDTMKKAIVLFLAASLCRYMLGAQSSAGASGPQQQTPAASMDSMIGNSAERLQLAMSSIEYPVTPSDTYLLTYRQSTGETVTKAVQVASDYQIDLGIFGKIDATKMTFVELKRRVENLYAESYARSYPSLNIDSVGVFRVSVDGEISRARYITAWGLTKLSDMVAMADAPNASLRNVLVRPRTSSSPTKFDVLKAIRLGDDSQDPFIRPNDTLTFTPAGRSIKLSGEIREPGNYELLKGEGLRVLIEQFGGGLTSDAEPTRIRIDRLSKLGPISEYYSLQKAYEANLNLDDCIGVNIPSKLESLPVVWFEGSIIASQQADGSAERMANATATLNRLASDTQPSPDSGTRIAVQINDGELLSDALREIRSSIQPMADLASASLFRQGSATPIAVNLQPLLATPNPSSDIPLRPYDRIFIPTLRSTVRVAGAVLEAGSFAYQPNSGAAYYIGLAGGADPLRNSGGACMITDALGNSRSSTTIIQPGDQVFVLTNLAGITVSGAVNVPGVFPFQSGLPPSLFINQAGGVDPERGTGSFFITDMQGKRQRSMDALSPGDRIYVRQNKIGHNIVQYLPVISGIVTLATSVITLYQVIR
jgi:polysaccharide biosynthesis/export protein